MTTTLREKLNRLPAARRKKIDERTRQLLLEEQSLKDLRKARRFTQVDIAKALRIRQEQVSRVEQRTDLHISTLRRHIQALGGDLTILATFPNGAPIRITGLGESE